MLRSIWTTPNFRTSRPAPYLLLLVEAVCLVLLTTRIAIADLLEDCKAFLPFGAPELTVTAHTTAVCRNGYIALHDDDDLVPRRVAPRPGEAHPLAPNGGQP